MKKKRVVKSDRTSVVFELTSTDLDPNDQVSVVGEFNDWEPSRHRMKQRKDGSWSATVRLPNSSRFEYRFLVNERTWVTDDQADDFVRNPFGEHNSVVDVA